MAEPPPPLPAAALTRAAGAAPVVSEGGDVGVAWEGGGPLPWEVGAELAPELPGVEVTWEAGAADVAWDGGAAEELPLELPEVDATWEAGAAFAPALGCGRPGADVASEPAAGPPRPFTSPDDKASLR